MEELWIHVICRYKYFIHIKACSDYCLPNIICAKLLPRKSLNNQFNLQFTVHQRLRPQPYVSEWYLIRRGDRQSCLEVDPPLLLREDVKIEFHVKPRVDIIKPKFMTSKKVTKQFSNIHELIFLLRYFMLI